jgi:hypothetical protein
MWLRSWAQNIHVIGILLKFETAEYEEYQDNTRPWLLHDTAQELQVKN